MKTTRHASKLTLVTCALLALLLSLTPVFAYFTKSLSLSKTIDESGIDNSAVVVSIPDFSTFAFYVNEGTYTSAQEAIEGSWNDGSAVSEVSSRRVLTLSSDLTLTRDVLMSSDAHLDLNNHVLYLNGHTLAIAHAYAGSQVIENGTIVLNADGETTNGGIVIDTPRSSIYLEDIAFETFDGTSVTETDAVTVLDMEPEYLAYRALALVASVFASPTDPSPLPLSSPLLAASTLVTGANGVYSYDPALFLTTRGACLVGSQDETCIFVTDDLELPTRVSAYEGLTYSYVSSSPAVLSSRGDVHAVSSGITTLTLDVSVARDGTVIGSASFTVHVVDITSEAQVMTMTRELIATALASRYDDADGVYVFNRGAQLPSLLSFGGSTSVSFGYAAYTTSACTVTSAAAFTQVSGEDMINFEPSTDSHCLRITLSPTVSGSAGIAVTIDIAIASSDTGIVITNASFAQDFLERAYGGTIIVPSHKDTIDETIYTYDNVSLLQPDAEATAHGITGITYALLNNGNGVYEIITNETLQVVTGKHPRDYVQTVQLDILFAFSDGSTVDMQLSVFCDDADSSNNISAFLPYYTDYSMKLYAATSGYTIDGFTMPFSYDRIAIVCFDIATVVDGVLTYNTVPALSVALYYDGASHDIGTPTGATGSYADLLDAYLTANSLTLASLIAYGDTKWVFSVDTSLIPTTNTSVLLIYNVKMTAATTNWTVYNDDGVIKYSTYILPGILRYDASTDKSTNADIIKDESFYAWIYNNFYTDNSYTAGGTDYLTKLILTDWLEQNVTLSVVDEPALASITDFAGLQYLVGTQVLDLTGAITSATEADQIAGYIAQMTSLSTLVLSDCAFRDKTSSSADDNGTVSGFAALPSLKVLRLDGNDIYSFAFLEDFPALESVYLYSNLSASTVDGIFYGSVGLTNMGVFQSLTDAGVAVYNTASTSGTSTTAILFENAKEVTDYVNLQNIEYQKKLATGVSITRLYKDFSTNPTMYSLKTSYTIGESSYTVSNRVLTWGYLDETGAFQTSADGVADTVSTVFVLRYTFTLSGTSVTLTMKYEVERT